MKILAQLPLNLQPTSYKDIPVGSVFCNNTTAYIKGEYGYTDLNSGDFFRVGPDTDTYYTVEVFPYAMMSVHRMSNEN